MESRNIFQRVNDWWQQRKADKLLSNENTWEGLYNNEEKVENKLNNLHAPELSIDNAQSWEPETGHPNGPSDSFAVRSFNWKRDGTYNLQYRNGGQKDGTCTEEEAKDLISAASKGRQQREI